MYERVGITPIDVWELDRVQYQILLKHVQEFNKVFQSKQEDVQKTFEKEKSKLILPPSYKSKR
jgi:hypothetical protein